MTLLEECAETHLETLYLITQMRTDLNLLTHLCNEADRVIRQNPKRLLANDPIVLDFIEEGTFKEQYTEYRNRLKRTYQA